MSRSGYQDDFDGNQWELIRWRGAVKSAIRGKRGQTFLRELAAEMDAMPEKRLIEGDLVTPEGECCTMGVVCKARGVDLNGVDPEDSDRVAKAMGLSETMVREIAFMNDEWSWKDETPEQRWERMRKWVSANLTQNTP